MYIRALARLVAISSSVTARRTFPGMPTTSDPSGITAFWGISAPAPMMQFLPTTAPLRMMAPMPTSVLSPTVQLWTMAL